MQNELMHGDKEDPYGVIHGCLLQNVGVIIKLNAQVYFPR